VTAAARQLRFAEALNEALREEMRADPTVFVLGEDVGVSDGTFGVTAGLLKEFGAARVIDTPISENTMVGAAIGAAMVGARPVVEIMFFDFITLAMDQIVNLGAKIRYMSGGQVKVPCVIRAAFGARYVNGATHVQSLEAFFQHVPGIKVVLPSNPADAKGLLKAAVRDDNIVLFLENKGLYLMRDDVPPGEHVVPLGQARVAREGADVTVLAYSAMVQHALTAADHLAREGIRAEVLDLRTLVPLDREAILASVRKTHRAVIAHEACRRGGPGAELGMLICEEAFDALDAPVARVGAADVPVPFSPPLKRRVVPEAEEIVEAVRKLG